MDLSKADRTLRNLKPKSAAYTVALGDGISCRVAPNGTKTLELRARLKGEIKRRTLGYYPATTIAAAAEKAAEYRSMMKQGHDPKVELQRAAESGIPHTVREAADRFIKGHISVKLRERSAKEAARLLNVDIVSLLGSYPLQQVKRTDLTVLLERKAAALRAKGGKAVAANRTAAVLSKFFGWCHSMGWVPADLGRNLPKLAAEVPKDRVLQPIEAGQLWNVLNTCTEVGKPIPSVHARVLQILALTGCRCSEVTALTTSSIDLVSSTMTITDGKTQASNRTLPLPAAARAIIEAQIQLTGGRDLLFPSPRVGKVIPSNAISRSAREIRTILNQAPWSPHDLRRSAITVMAEAGIDGDIRRRVTGHRAEDVHGRIYDRAARLDDMRGALQVLERWYTAAALKAAADGADNSNVVPIKVKERTTR